MTLNLILTMALIHCNGPSEYIYYVERIGQTDTPVTDLNSIDWSNSNLLTDFISPWQDAPANTTFRALWDQENFYFKFDVQEKNILIYRKDDAEQEVVGSERVEIFFRQNDQLNPYYCLEMDAAGRIFDNEVRHYRQYNPQWTWPEGQLQIKAERNHNGYSLSGKITIKSLKELGLLKENKLQAGLYRGRCLKIGGNDFSFHWISWVDPKTEKPDFHVASSFGELVLVK